MTIDYNKQAELYERTRKVFPVVFSTLSCLLSPVKGEAVLDFGCGTGNYLTKFVSEYEINPFGIEPSASMRQIAQRKLSVDNIRDGDHTRVPFPRNSFRKIYSTDVIHHIQHLDEFFLNLFNVATYQAKLCICTESSYQLSEKYWNKYFPDILTVDLKRFHSIDKIISEGQKMGWTHTETVTIETEITEPISSDFMECVEKKTISALQLISTTAYNIGYSLMKTDYLSKIPLQQQEGYTFILFKKEK